MLLENCSLLRTDNVHRQISEHIFVPNGGYCLFNSLLPPTLSGPVSITSHGIGEKIVPSVFPGTPILQLSNEKNTKLFIRAKKGLLVLALQTNAYTQCMNLIIFVQFTSALLNEGKIGNKVWQVAEPYLYIN